MCALPACISTHHMYTWYSLRQDEDFSSPRTAFTDGCDLPCGSWQSNLGPREKQPTFLTPEPSIQPPKLSTFCKILQEGNKAKPESSEKHLTTYIPAAWRTHYLLLNIPELQDKSSCGFFPFPRLALALFQRHENQKPLVLP